MLKNKKKKIKYNLKSNSYGFHHQKFRNRRNTLLITAFLIKAYINLEVQHFLRDIMQHLIKFLALILGGFAF